MNIFQTRGFSTVSLGNPHEGECMNNQEGLEFVRKYFDELFVKRNIGVAIFVVNNRKILKRHTYIYFEE